MSDVEFPPQDQAFDPAWNLLYQPGYGHTIHTRIKPGVKVHFTRESLDYALTLLESAEVSRVARAMDIIRAVLPLQDVHPTSPSFGLWPWYAEEPVAEMSPPDYNWAEFMSSIFAEILVLHRARLANDIVAEIRTALQRACLCIFRRNVGVGYTNINFMGGIAMAAAGEILGDDIWLAYGRQRLNDFVSHMRRDGIDGFGEFNSPTYTRVVVIEGERLLRIVRDPACRAAGIATLDLAWEQISENFHVPTQQWAGPQSRSYHIRLDPAIATFLARRTGTAITLADGHQVQPQAEAGSYPCPAVLAERFRTPVATPRTSKRTVNRAAKLGNGLDIVTTTWMDSRRSLGTVSGFITANQNRQQHAFWGTPGGVIARLQAVVRKDGRVFCPAWMWAAQDGPRALLALAFADDMGDWNGWVDVPPEGIHRCQDLSLRIELDGAGATAEVGEDGLLVLSCAGERAVIHPLADCSFGGRQVAWSTGVGSNQAWATCVLHTGGELMFHPGTHGETVCAWGIELLALDEQPLAGDPSTAIIDADRRSYAWPAAGLAIEARRQDIGFRRMW